MSPGKRKTMQAPNNILTPDSVSIGGEPEKNHMTFTNNMTALPIVNSPSVEVFIFLKFPA
jgi:hypothetical protein